MSSIRQITLSSTALTAEAFAAFGDVIEAGQHPRLINHGTTRQFADLARVDVAAQGGRPRVSLYRTTPYRLPLVITMLERHPLSSQLFMPLHGEPFLAIVAPPGEHIEPSSIRAFLTDGRQGVNYRRGTWHHPVIAVRDGTEFLVVDRAGRGRNCDEYRFDGVDIVVPA